MSIPDLLQKYNVGTEKYKAPPPPPNDLSLLGPIRSQDFRSVHKQASDRIKHKNNNRNGVSQQNPDDIIFNTTTTYQQTIKLIVAIHRLLREKQAADINILQSYVGYKILEERASPLTFAYRGNVNRQTTQIIRLIELGNADYRSTKPRQKTKK
jgi:hypothetical protein